MKIKIILAVLLYIITIPVTAFERKMLFLSTTTERGTIIVALGYLPYCPTPKDTQKYLKQSGSSLDENMQLLCDGKVIADGVTFNEIGI